MAVASIKVTGNVTEAMAALEALGIKAETVGKGTASTFERSSAKVGSTFTKLGKTLGNWGIPFSESLVKMGEKIEAADTKAKRLGETMLATSKIAVAGVAAGFGVAAVEGVKLASKYQAATQLLVTAGGEAQKNLGLVRDGILKISGATGTSAEQLSEGMYIAEKAGYRAAAGLNVLKMAAEGAKAENVDLQTAVNALSDVMVDYHMKASQAAQAENMIVEASGRSKTTMQDFAGSLASVVPLASSLGIKFPQVGAAIATMTQHGMSAQQATQNLANTITNLAGQNGVATQAMNQLGLSVNDIDKNLGKRGLTGTLDLVMDKIKGSSKAGEVVVSAFKQSATATADYKTELDNMTPSLRAMSEAYLHGKTGYADYLKSIKGLGAGQYELGKSFIATVHQAKGFNDQLTSGKSAVRTTATELQKLLGGMTGMKTALMLTGENSTAFAESVKKIGEAGKTSGSDIMTWAKTSKLLGVQSAELRQTLEALLIKLGTALIPAVTKVAHAMLTATEFFEKHKDAAIALGGAISSILVPALAVGAWGAFMKVTGATRGLVKGLLGVPGVLRNVSYGFRDGETAANGYFGVAGKVGAFARSVGSGIASIASSVATTAAAMGRATVNMVKSGAVWVAEHAVQTAAIVGQFVAQAAAATAAFIAENVATLGLVAVIGALIGAIVLIATHWRQVKDAIVAGAKEMGKGLKAAWHGVQVAAEAVWKAIEKRWRAVESTLDAGVKAVGHFFSSGFGKVRNTVSAVFDWIKGHWPLLLGILTGPIGLAVAEIAKHWTQIITGAKNVLTSVKNAFSDVGSLLYDSGKALIEGFAHGITDAAGAAWDAAKGVVGKVRNLFPFSPAKEGPFSGKGWTKYSGEALAHDFAKGIGGSTQHVADVAKKMLKQVKKQLDSTNNQLDNARAFASAFNQANPFAAGLATTGSKTKSGYVNGVWTTTTQSNKLTTRQINQEMDSYLEKQLKQARTFDRDISKLKKEHISKAMLNEIQQAGVAGLPYVEALANGSKAQVKEMSKLTASIDKAYGHAGARSTGAKSMTALQKQKANEKAIENGITKALKHLQIEIKHNKLRTSA